MHTLLQVISSKLAPTLHLCPLQPLATLFTPPPSPPYHHPVPDGLRGCRCS